MEVFFWHSPAFCWPSWWCPFLDRGLTNVTIAVGIAKRAASPGWRGSTLAARRSGIHRGVRHRREQRPSILVVQILPNIIGPIVVLATLTVGTSILSVVGLELFGLGAQPPVPDWGGMISQGRQFLRDGLVGGGVSWAWPSSITVLGFNLLGDGLRDAPASPHAPHQTAAISHRDEAQGSGRAAAGERIRQGDGIWHEALVNPRSGRRIGGHRIGSTRNWTARLDEDQRLPALLHRGSRSALPRPLKRSGGPSGWPKPFAGQAWRMWPSTAKEPNVVAVYPAASSAHCRPPSLRPGCGHQARPHLDTVFPDETGIRWPGERDRLYGCRV